MMSFLTHTSSRLFSIESNPVIRILLNTIFYKHFCAGQTIHEARRTTEQLRSLGYSGVILAYAKETELDQGKPQPPDVNTISEESIRQEMTPWVDGVLSTIVIASAGDFVALKFSGAGSHTLHLLSMNLNPSPLLNEIVDSICAAAIKRDVRLLIDAEQAALQKTVDAWSLDWMAKYNRGNKRKAVIYGTYQAYLKSTPSVISKHLQVARKKKFTLGIKLVRGAYLGSDPRHLIHDSKVDTDNAYNNIAASLAKQEYGSMMVSDGNRKFPDICVMLASHNIDSIRKIQKLRKKQKNKGDKGADLVYAQLQGMADEVSCELVLAGRQETDVDGSYSTKTYKYLVWGTMNECLSYLLRRGQENRDAVERTRKGRNEMWKELWRRTRKRAFLGY